jgi:hypothetical protein
MTTGDRCRAEINYLTGKLRAGHPDQEMLEAMLVDLFKELEIIEHPAEPVSEQQKGRQ